MQLSTLAGTGLALAVLYRFLKSQLLNIIIDATTALNDLKELGTPRSTGRIQGTAVVCGGSIAGLWAAQICSDHFEDVLIVEPEAWLASEDGRTTRYDENGVRKEIVSSTRSRIMQYEKPHIFMPFYLTALRRLFPNVDEEFTKSSAHILPAWSDITYKGEPIVQTFPQHYPNGNYPMTIFATRVCVETILRRLVYQPGGRIRWLTGTVTAFNYSNRNAEKIESVSVRTANGMQDIPASLVVDCTGSSRVGEKLIERWQMKIYNKSTIEEHTISYKTDVKVHTFRFLVQPEMRNRLPIPGGYAQTGQIYTWFGLGKGEDRSIFGLCLDGHRIEITCYSASQPLPNEPSEIIGWANTLRGHKPVEPWFLEMIQILQENPLDEFIPYSIPPSYWIHYDELQDLPSNFVATGDSLMFLNPRWGQGCTKACIDALALDKTLRATSKKSVKTIPSNFSKQYFKLQAQRIKATWDGAKQVDYENSKTTPAKGETLETGGFGRAFATLILQLAAEGDEQVAFAFWSSRMFIAPLTDLLHPVILVKALFLRFRIAIGFSKPIEREVG